MAYDTASVANYLVALLNNLTGIAGAQIGAPESVGRRVSAYVTAGSQSLNRVSKAVTARSARYFILFAYRVDGAEGDAEMTLMRLVDAFLQLLEDDRTLGGTCEGIELDIGLADEPDYQLRAGKEYREYPIILTAMQYREAPPSR